MANTTTSYLSGNLIILVSQVVPTFVMPLYHLEISGRLTWFVRLVMWLAAPVIVLPAYALRRLKQWKKRGQQAHMEGLLPLNELIELIYLHEKGQGYGGTLNDHVGKAMRCLLEGQISWEASSTHVETEGSRSSQAIGSVGSTNVQSIDQEGTTVVEAESTIVPTSIRSHRQEGSTAVADVRTPGLRRRGERSTESYELAVSIISMHMPENPLIKGHIHESSTPVSNEYVKQGASNRRPLQRYLPLQELSNSVTPLRHRIPLMESYRNKRKDSGLVTDSFLLEQG